MQKNLFIGAVALFKLVAAWSLMSDADNGIWYMNRDGNGDLNLTTRLDFEYKPEPSKNHLRIRQPSSQDEDHRRPEEGFWPWKQSGSSLSDSTTSTSTARFRLSPQRSAAADTPSLPVKQSECGNLELNPADAYYAEQMMAAYCAAVGYVDAYQHLASKFNSVIVYICARGHPETCSSADMLSAMQWLDTECYTAKSGWVYNNYIHKDAPGNKYGRDDQGANFC
ncbi:hypothetical protein PFICI_07690 [Pestalotiopsis fici W106-1]|uniref:Ecp2 effector protein domain-containing protein n=1 Tax=Pestalotiopsis fici (strain W106-1 / CGMCC3.15140) TaxID=1229662 RepID=W3X4Q8_PESFW|nr:uncharacterized protein PFICI_07690 [Pestalotiopsis fici W106-1]ETS80161.1 hypothetical protein PFICI_07690 [Pestalotiopsis fici W106-1]